MLGGESETVQGDVAVLLVAERVLEDEAQRAVLVELLAHAELHCRQRVEVIVFGRRHHLGGSEAEEQVQVVVPLAGELVAVAVVSLVEHVFQGVEVRGGVLAALADAVVVALFHVV